MSARLFKFDPFEKAFRTMTARSAAAAAAAPQAPVAPQPSSAPETVKALFYVAAPADPGLMPRLIEPMAKLGLVPSRVHASSEAGDGTELAVEMRLGAVSPRAAHQIECALRAVIGVRQVIAVIEAVRG